MSSVLARVFAFLLLVLLVLAVLVVLAMLAVVLARSFVGNDVDLCINITAILSAPLDSDYLRYGAKQEVMRDIERSRNISKRVKLKLVRIDVHGDVRVGVDCKTFKSHTNVETERRGVDCERRALIGKDVDDMSDIVGLGNRQNIIAVGGAHLNLSAGIRPDGFHGDRTLTAPNNHTGAGRDVESERVMDRECSIGGVAVVKGNQLAVNGRGQYGLMSA